MPFWTVEDAGPYKEKSNFLMRTSSYGGAFSCAFHFEYKYPPERRMREEEKPFRG